MICEHWLNPWLRLLADRTEGGPLLEIGCGNGDDTAVLVEYGLKVIALDLSPEAISQARVRAPDARFECQDMRAPFPSGTQCLGAIVASLSLHYFSWAETLLLVERIRTSLRVGGVLLCRVNSVEDHNYGATGYSQIERNYYMVRGQPKRFFDRGSLEELFSVGWHLLSLQHSTTNKYRMPKALWELVAERDA